MRLDYLIANGTPLSRKEAKKAISQGRVTVDGQLCRKPNTSLDHENAVMLDGVEVSLDGPCYLMLHKPSGYVSAASDSLSPTVTDLLDSKLPDDLHIAGRLDKDTTGLVLLTNDGDWSHRVTAPRHECMKRYEVTLAEAISDAAIEQLQSGVLLKGEDKPTRPATVIRRSETEISLELSEGKYHQVKRMMAAVGNRVERLHRSRIGKIALDDTLAPGEYRPLSDDEINSV